MGGFTLVCQGWLTVKFVVGGKTTKQALYICKKIQWLYFSQAVCIDVGILPEDFLHTAATVSTHANIAMQYTLLRGTHEKLGPNTKPDEGGNQLPNHPKNPPFSAMQKSISRLIVWLLEHFVKTALKNDGVFPSLSGPATHIHLKEGAIPKARHNPIPVPFHFKGPVRQALWKDVERGNIGSVPVGMTTNWCSTMVIPAKRNRDHGEP